MVFKEEGVNIHIRTELFLSDMFTLRGINEKKGGKRRDDEKECAASS